MKTLHMDSWPPIDSVRLDQAHGLWTRSAWRLGSWCQFLILSHIVSMLNLCCEKYRKSNPMEKADHVGRTAFVYTYCVAFLSWRWGYSTAIQVSKRLHLTMGKGVVVNRTGIRLWVHDAHIKPSLLTSNFYSWQQCCKKLHAYVRGQAYCKTIITKQH